MEHIQANVDDMAASVNTQAPRAMDGPSLLGATGLQPASLRLRPSLLGATELQLASLSNGLLGATGLQLASLSTGLLGATGLQLASLSTGLTLVVATRL